MTSQAPSPLLLPGLVCVSPGTDTYHPATVLAISATVAPLLHVGARNVLLRATEIDDPLDVFATHLVPGVVGLGRLLKIHKQTIRSTRIQNSNAAAVQKYCAQRSVAINIKQFLCLHSFGHLCLDSRVCSRVE